MRVLPGGIGLIHDFLPLRNDIHTFMPAMRSSEKESQSNKMICSHVVVQNFGTRQEQSLGVKSNFLIAIHKNHFCVRIGVLAMVGVATFVANTHGI